MDPRLNDDILLLVCEELAVQRDFGTLFACSTVNQSLAKAALSVMYRSQHAAPIKDESSNEAISLADQALVIQKWSVLWRTIILSCLPGQTIIQYVTNLRVLDLRDLDHMLQDDRFRGRVLDNFFAGPLQRFHLLREPHGVTRAGSRRPARLDITAIINAIGDLITATARNLESISGPISSESLLRWIPKMPKLESLELFDGTALAAKGTGSLIRHSCPNFHSCEFYVWVDSKSDEQLEDFLSGLAPQSLSSFITYSISGLGPQSCLALSSHGQSLRDLRLIIPADIVPNLGFLRGCTSVGILDITDGGSGIDLEQSHKDVFLEIIAWLRGCSSLQSLGIHDFISGTALVVPVLLEEKISLRRLEVSKYASRGRITFHQALVHQSDLESLVLDADPVDVADDLAALSHSLGVLMHLRQLRLLGISLYFSESQVEALAQNHDVLEELYIGGLQLGDATLQKLASLPNLRVLTFAGITTFTLEGLLDFVARLKSGNRGFTLVVDNADPEDGLTEADQMRVRATIAEKLEGRFDYQFIQDPDVSEFEGESD